MGSTQDQFSQGTGTGAGTGTPGAAGDAARQYVPRPAPGYDDTSASRPSGLVIGFTAMAAVMMMLSGLWTFLAGLAAIIRGAFFVVLPNYAFNVSVSSWGWTHLIIGIVVFAAGACLFTGMMWARVTGIVLAMFSAVWNFIYLPYTPVWSIVVIAIDVFVIWALMQPQPRRRRNA